MYHKCDASVNSQPHNLCSNFFFPYLSNGSPKLQGHFVPLPHFLSSVIVRSVSVTPQPCASDYPCQTYHSGWFPLCLPFSEWARSESSITTCLSGHFLAPVVLVWVYQESIVWWGLGMQEISWWEEQWKVRSIFRPWHRSDLTCIEGKIKDKSWTETYF